MGKNEKTPIVLDGIEYFYEDMTSAQQVIVNHLHDLDRKIQTAQFNLDQLTVGKHAFVQMLKEEFSKTAEQEKVEKVEVEVLDAE